MPRLNRRQLQMHPLRERVSKLAIAEIAVRPDGPAPALPPHQAGQVARLVERIRAARAQDRPVMLTYGAHLIKNGLGPVLIALLEEGWVTHLATNGAGSIHDWEFAYLGRSSEDVRANVARGQFGTWEETGRWINLALAAGGLDGLGYGASVGALIAEEHLEIPPPAALRAQLAALAATEAPDETLGALADALALITTGGVEPGHYRVPHPHQRFSVQAAAARVGVPLTVHPGIGYDIIYTHPLNSGGVIGRAAVRDFLSYADSVSRLTGGVHLTVGSAIMAPMIFEKSLSMANNLARQIGPPLTDYLLVVNDIQAGGDWDWRAGEPPMDHPAYYLRFCKTFHRMGGELDYVQADNRAFLVGVYQALTKSSS
ncbi:MAG TPA: hypothetical protein PLZ36_03905 [Armatimonadota bacterium]|nr:hypothetical protein [Armatimonadota bacterium]HOS42737.1 hypothetical protein [Armatimonadota bacterium]